MKGEEYDDEWELKRASGFSPSEAAIAACTSELRTGWLYLHH